MTSDDPQPPTREEYRNLKALVEALQRRLSQAESSIETLENQLEHRRIDDSPWRGAKKRVVKELSEGDIVTPGKLAGMQETVGPVQAENNAKTLLKSDWFEPVGGGQHRFVGAPDR